MRPFIKLLCLLCCHTIINVSAQVPDNSLRPDSLQQTRYTLTSGVPVNDMFNLSYSNRLGQQTPDVNAMIRNITTPADKYTGTLNIQVPIWSISTNSGDIPIHLYYTASGIKNDDIASIVGLGWGLAAGGKITRVVKGQPDNLTQLKKTSKISLWDLALFQKCNDEDWDTQRDIYYYETPNLSGSFVLDDNGGCIPVPHQNIRISRAYNDGFTITDTQGTTYYFTTNETIQETYAHNDNSVTYVSTWYLDRIVYINGAEVNLTYITGDNYQFKHYNYITRVEYHNSQAYGTRIREIPEESRDVTTTIEVQEPKYLSSISYRDQEVKFEYDDRGTYDVPKYKRLKSIDIYTSTSKIRSFVFDYYHFPNGSLKLLGLDEKPTQTLIKPICDFEYYEDEVLYARDYYGFDHWGYRNSDVSIPSKCPIIPYETVVNTSAFGSSRLPVFKYTRAQSLKKILYPNGGYKEFIYELHSGLNQKTNTHELAGGLRIKEIIEKENTNATPSVYRYEYDGGIIYDSSFAYCTQYWNLRYLKIYMHSNIPDGVNHFYDISSRSITNTQDFYGGSVVYSKVTEYLPNGSHIEYNYIPYDQYKDIEPEDYIVTETGTEYYSKELSGRTPKTIRSWGRNLLKEQKVYDSQNILLDHQSFEYELDTVNEVRIPSYKMIYDIFGDYYERPIEENPIPTRHDYALGKYEWISCPITMTKGIVHKTKYTLPQTTEYVYNERYLPELIITRECDGSCVTQKLTYAEVDDEDEALSLLCGSFVASPIEQITYKDGYVIDAELQLYKYNELKPFTTVVPSKKLSFKKQEKVDSLAFTPWWPKWPTNYDSRYHVIRSYDEYNVYGDLVSYHDANGIQHSLIYGPGSAPIAKVDNAYHSTNKDKDVNQLYFNDFETSGTTDPHAKSGNKVMSILSGVRYSFNLSNLEIGSYIVTYWYRTATDMTWKKQQQALNITDMHKWMIQIDIPIVSEATAIDDLSVLPQNASLTSAVTITGVGPISQTNERGYTTYYEYNALGLPTRILDDNRTVMKKYEYDPITLIKQ